MTSRTRSWAAMLRAMQPPAVLAVLFAAVAAVAVGAMALTVPPFCNADEAAHFMRADQVARGVLVAARPGGLVDPGIGEVAGLFDALHFHAETKAGAAAMRAARLVHWGRARAAGFPNTALYPPTGYLPAAASILVGRHLGWPVADTLTAARLVNGAVCIAAGAAAIALSGGMAAVLFTVLCLPMSLSLFAAVSQDGVLIAAAALAAAALAAGGRKWLWLAGVCLGILAMGRPPYLPMAACLLTLGAPRWRWRVACAAGLGAGVLAWSLLCAAPVAAATGRPAGIDPARQVAWLLGHKALLYQVPIVTLVRQWQEGLPYLRQFVGVLGWLDVPLPGLYTAGACAMIVLAAVLAVPVAGGRAGRLAVLVAIAASCAGIFAGQYLTWTQVGSRLIEGVQGRYFLPLALFAPLARPPAPAWTGRSRATSWRRPATALLAAFPALSIAVALRAITQRYGP